MQTGRRPEFQPRVEALEDRTLMAAQLTASLAGGVLRIEGTHRADTIVVRQSHDRISVDHTPIQVRGGKVGNVSARSVARIVVRGHDGNDRILLGGEATRGPNSLRETTVVLGGDGNDVIRGGQGTDVVYGEGGHDNVQGRGGRDFIDGGAGYDRVEGNNGNDYLRGGTGHDRLSGGNGRDRVEGGSGNDYVFGGVERDLLDGGSGRNVIVGEAGGDVIYSRSGTDLIHGGAGVDVVHFTQAIAPRSNNPGGGVVRDVEVFDVPARQTASAPVAFGAQARRLVDLINAYRARHGLPALKVDARLTEAARYQAAYMARTGHYAHVNRDGRDLGDRLTAARYSYTYASENIHLYDPAVRRTLGVDRAYPVGQLAEYFVDGWKASRGHNQNLLSRQARHVGVALAQDRSGRIFAVQVSARP